MMLVKLPNHVCHFALSIPDRMRTPASSRLSVTPVSIIIYIKFCPEPKGATVRSFAVYSPCLGASPACTSLPRHLPTAEPANVCHLVKVSKPLKLQTHASVLYFQQQCDLRSECFCQPWEAVVPKLEESDDQRADCRQVFQQQIFKSDLDCQLLGLIIIPFTNAQCEIVLRLEILVLQSCMMLLTDVELLE